MQQELWKRAYNILYISYIHIYILDVRERTQVSQTHFLFSPLTEQYQLEYKLIRYLAAARIVAMER